VRVCSRLETADIGDSVALADPIGDGAADIMTACGWSLCVLLNKRDGSRSAARKRCWT